MEERRFLGKFGQLPNVYFPNCAFIVESASVDRAALAQGALVSVGSSQTFMELGRSWEARAESVTGRITRPSWQK